ncbi:MAG: rhodanese-like domain-containing protein [Rhodobacteraceae bacterium]|nr:rhodanese-like domain-containing protein [Paracoccaceae bacterium]
MRPEVTKIRNSQSRFLSRRRVLALSAGGFAGFALAGPVWAQGQTTDIMTAADAHAAALAGEVILVDIRRPDEWLETGIGEGAIGLDMRADEFVPSLVALRQSSPDKPIALICRTGNRSKFVVSALAGQGFPGLVDVAEGMAGGRNGTGWVPSGLPVYAGTEENVAARVTEILPCITC